MRALPVLHADVASPADLVRCPTFSATLTAKACAGRTLALKPRPGDHRVGHVVAGIAQHPACARCDLGAVVRGHLSLAGEPGRVDVVHIGNVDDLDPDSPDRDARPVTLSPDEESVLAGQGWRRADRGWVDLYGARYSDDAARTIARRERVLLVTAVEARRKSDGPPCATVGCTERVGGKHAKTATELAPLCAACRVRANVAIRYGTATLATVGAWLSRTTERALARKSGDLAPVVPIRPPPRPGPRPAPSPEPPPAAAVAARAGAR